MTRKLIVFDFDGTLIDSLSTYDEALAEFSQSRNLPWDRDKMAHGYTDPAANDLGWGLVLTEQKPVLEEYGRYIVDQMNQKKRFIADFFPDAIDVLTELNASYDLALITARNRLTTNIILKHHQAENFFPHFRTLCCARERGYPIKPAPDSLHCLLRDTKHEAHNVIVVGDTTSDIFMASNAGAKSIAALWGAHDQEKLETAKPTIFLKDIKDIPQAAATLFA